MAEVLEYAEPPSKHPNRWYFYFSVLFSAAPLITGVGSLVLYVLTRSELFVRIGLNTLVLGIPSIVIAGMFIFWYSEDARGCSEQIQATVSRRCVFILWLIFSNFPAALLCAYVGIGLMK